MKHFQTILKSFSISGNLNSIRNGDEIMDIKFEEAKTLKEKPTGALGFGKIYTDYMFIADYDADQGGWHDARIVPFGPIELSPASMVLHYAQETFEGLKAYRTKDGVIQLFRPEMNARRFMNSNERLSMPKVPEDMFIDAIKALVEVEKTGCLTKKENRSIFVLICLRQKRALAYILPLPINLLLFVRQ